MAFISYSFRYLFVLECLDPRSAPLGSGNGCKTMAWAEYAGNPWTRMDLACSDPGRIHLDPERLTSMGVWKTLVLRGRGVRGWSDPLGSGRLPMHRRS